MSYIAEVEVTMRGYIELDNPNPNDGDLLACINEDFFVTAEFVDWELVTEPKEDF